MNKTDDELQQIETTTTKLLVDYFTEIDIDSSDILTVLTVSCHRFLKAAENIAPERNIRDVFIDNINMLAEHD